MTRRQENDIANLNTTDPSVVFQLEACIILLRWKSRQTQRDQAIKLQKVAEYVKVGMSCSTCASRFVKGFCSVPMLCAAHTEQPVHGSAALWGNHFCR